MNHLSEAFSAFLQAQCKEYAALRQTKEIALEQQHQLNVWAAVASARRTGGSYMAELQAIFENHMADMAALKRKYKAYLDTSASGWSWKMLTTVLDSLKDPVLMTRMAFSGRITNTGTEAALADRIQASVLRTCATISDIVSGPDIGQTLDFMGRNAPNEAATRLVLDRMLMAACREYGCTLAVEVSEKGPHTIPLPTAILDYVVMKDGRPIGVIEAKKGSPDVKLEECEPQVVMQLLHLQARQLIQSLERPVWALLTNGFEWRWIVLIQWKLWRSEPFSAVSSAALADIISVLCRLLGNDHEQYLLDLKITQPPPPPPPPPEPKPYRFLLAAGRYWNEWILYDRRDRHVCYTPALGRRKGITSAVNGMQNSDHDITAFAQGPDDACVVFGKHHGADGGIAYRSAGLSVSAVNAMEDIYNLQDRVLSVDFCVLGEGGAYVFVYTKQDRQRQWQTWSAYDGDHHGLTNKLQSISRDYSIAHLSLLPGGGWYLVGETSSKKMRAWWQLGNDLLACSGILKVRSVFSERMVVSWDGRSVYIEGEPGWATSGYVPACIVRWLPGGSTGMYDWYRVCLNNAQEEYDPQQEDDDEQDDDYYGY